MSTGVTGTLVDGGKNTLIHVQDTRFYGVDAPIYGMNTLFVLPKHRLLASKRRLLASKRWKIDSKIASLTDRPRKPKATPKIPMAAGVTETHVDMPPQQGGRLTANLFDEFQALT